MIEVGDTVTWGENGTTINTRTIIADELMAHYLAWATSSFPEQPGETDRQKHIREKQVLSAKWKLYAACMAQNSPVASALLGKEVGDQMEIETSAGTKYVTVLSIVKGES